MATKLKGKAITKAIKKVSQADLNRMVHLVLNPPKDEEPDPDFNAEIANLESSGMPHKDAVRTALTRRATALNAGESPEWGYDRPMPPNAPAKAEWLKNPTVFCGGVWKPAAIICERVLNHNAQIGLDAPRDTSDPEVMAQVQCTDCAQDHMVIISDEHVTELLAARLRLKSEKCPCYMSGPTNPHNIGDFVTTDHPEFKIPLTQLAGRVVRFQYQDTEKVEFVTMCDLCFSISSKQPFPIVDATTPSFFIFGTKGAAAGK